MPARKRATKARTVTKRAAKLARAAAESPVFCPVCPDWQIKHPERCGNTLKRSGATLYFCTKRCKERFEKNPAAFG